jgi:archaeal flagellar protein FlaI
MNVDYVYDKENQRLKINCMGYIYGPSLEDYDVWMAAVIDKLLELKRLVKVVLAERREYEYDTKEIKLLLEIAGAIEKITREKIVSLKNVVIKNCEHHAPKRFSFLQKLLNELRYDPVEAYKWLKREIRHVNVKMEREYNLIAKKCYQHYLEKTLLPIKKILEDCTLIQITKDRLTEHKNRALYRTIFHPSVKPNFMYTRYVATPPVRSELVERYRVEDIDVEIYKIPGKLRRIYHIIPPEFRLDGNEYALLDKARQYIGSHEPREIELTEPETVRENIYRISIDLLRDIAEEDSVNLPESKIKELANILTRYTAGLGILELILKDENVQDISVNSPVGKSPIYLFHGVHQECETNIVPSLEDAESWATRFRLMSSRPLDEASPVLDTEITVPGGSARIAAITKSLSPDGLAFAFRRHRDRPWTFPLFIKNKMIDPFSAGLLWFTIDGARTMLVAGTRSAGKTSFLGSCMLQIMPKIRIVVSEDTLELPVAQLQNIGYNIQRLKSRSVITHVETELAADEALRTALRLGDSALILGEVRSREALALYEAMRIGALANVVAGTIHGDSAYSVFDRVVNDLGVPATSFKATDIIVVANVIRSADGLNSFRRVTGITEVRKHWKNDPMEEGGFVNLMEYSAKDDVLKPTKILQMGESNMINSIASNVREWKNSWDKIWDNINLRAKILQTLTEYSASKNKPELLEAQGVMESNSMFHIIGSEVRQESGFLDSTEIFSRWHAWLKTK